jgi:copper homeostasis protein
VRLALEIAVSTPEEAMAAVRAGADRLELAAALELGGLTPSLGLFSRVRELVEAPVWVLLRPRPGGFTYTCEEMEVIARDARNFLDAGADGIVLGALDSEGGVDADFCRPLAERAAGRIAFHRAFDFVADTAQALEQLIQLGFVRVLTSGGKPSALEGSATIAGFVRGAAGRIEIMPGGRVRPDNVAAIVGATGCRQIHAGARSGVRDHSLKRNRPLAAAMGAAELDSTALDADLVLGLRRELDRLNSLP